MRNSTKYDKILDALQSLLEHKTLQNISVSEIAQTAGIGKTTESDISDFHMNVSFTKTLLIFLSNSHIMIHIWKKSIQNWRQ